jgi:Ca2+-binding EF-hand superfamily protein
MPECTCPSLRFLSNTLIPEEKAFSALGEEQVKKLTEIYNDIDFDDLKAIDLHKAVRFNKYIQENIPEAKAEKDANDFLKSTAICNKHSVNIDEWIFSFSKLYVCDQEEFKKFIEDYDAAVALQGKLKAINI